MTNWKSLRWYLLISFGLAWVLFLIPLAIGELGSRTRQIALTIFWAIAMWAPGLAAILTARLVDREPRGILNLRRLGPKRFYLWAWLAPIGLAIFTGLLTWAFGIGQFDPEFTLIRAVLAQAPNTPDISPALIVAGQSLFALTLAPLFNTLFALGEELGWRGFLLPRLLPMGQWRAILLSGIIWGLWHAPVILQGHNYPTRPVRGVFMMIVFTVLCGAFFSWLYLETRSPWAPALAHGALNASAGLPLLFLKGVDISIGGTTSSVIGWIPLAIIVGWLVWSRRLPVENRGDKEA